MKNIQAAGRIRLRFSSRGLRTAGGITLSFTALLLFISGFVRGELASLLWGGTLLFLLLFSLLSVFFGALINIRIRKTAAPMIPPVFHDESVTAGYSISEERKLPYLLRSFPGVSASYQLRYRFKKRSFSPEAAFGPEPGDFTISGVPLWRGRYRGRAFLVFRDIPGIFQAEFALPGEGLLNVHPRKTFSGRSELLPSLGGAATPEVKRKRESSELFDMRKFYPGDDPRKLHWKLYAHGGELFLRQGEPEPPPSGRYQVFLDTDLRALLPSLPGFSRRKALRCELVFEHFISRAAEFLTDLLRRESEVILLCRGCEARSFFPADERLLLNHLSGLYSDEESDKTDLNTGDTFPGMASGIGVYLFSTPFSQSRQVLYDSLKEMEGGAHVRLLSPRPPALPPRRSPGIKGLLFHEPRFKGEDRAVDPGWSSAPKFGTVPAPAFPSDIVLLWARENKLLEKALGREVFHAL